jgi:hypothetical protein
MANPECGLTKLVDDASCYACLSPAQKKAAIIYYRLLALAANGGTDYDTATFPSELVSDANALFRIKGTIDLFDSPLLTALVAIAAKNAENAGAVLPASVSDLEPKLTLLLNAPNLDIIWLWVECSLGTWKAFPQ